MSAKVRANTIKTKYAVRLGLLANSFYDPYSKCNLFKKTPFYFFDHAPTKAIITGIKGGKLIDLLGNIELEPTATTSTATSAAAVDVEALKAQLRIEVESEIKAEMAMKEAESKVEEEKSPEESKSKATKKGKKEEE